MHITLIKPAIGQRGTERYVDEARMEPLMLGVLAGLTPKEHHIALYDDRIEDIPYDIETDLVAITIESFTARRGYEIASHFRERNIPVIMGGMHVMLIPDEVLEHSDSILIGDAETIWATIVGDAEKGDLKRIYKAPPGVAQCGGYHPRWDLYEGKGYLPIALMQYTRGCNHQCSFCAVSKYFDRKHYIRKIDDVVREISEQNKKTIFFVDDNIAVDKKALYELCLELIPLKINWVSQASLDVVHHPKVMRAIADSGCIGNVIGFESILQDNLKASLKAPNIHGFTKYAREIELLREYSLQTWAAFTLGYDNDTVESIKATAEFARKNKFTFAAFNTLTPYPGTALYDQLQSEGRLLFDDKWWLHDDFRFNHAAFNPKLMTAQELTDASFAARKHFNSIGSLLYRFSDIKTNLRTLKRASIFLRYTLLFRKEVFKKQGLKI